MTAADLRSSRAPRARSVKGGSQAAPAEPLPRLQFTQIAFAGHNRPGDLGDPARVAAGLESAFTILAQAGVRDARLLTGLAPGADLLAAKAWAAASSDRCTASSRSSTTPSRTGPRG